jgi:archaellum component FlaC
MSDEAQDNKTPDVKLDAAGGFMPSPPPPALSPDEAGVSADDAGMSDSDFDIAGTMPDGSVAVPHDTAKRALEAVQILVENNRAASQQLESLMSIVLDAAEVANRSASAVATTGGHVNKAAEKLIDGAQRSATQAKLVLGIAGAVMIGSAGVFSFMSVQLQNKVSQLDEMTLAVGKRAVDLKRRMESMDDIHTALEDLKLSQENTQSVQQAIEEKISKLSDAPKAAPRPESKPAQPGTAAAAPAKPEPSAEVLAVRKAEAQARAEAARAEAAKADAANKALLQQLTSLDAMLKDQSKSVKDLSGQFNRLQGSVANVESVKKDVEALAQQQKQREKEMAQELAAEKARREKELKDKERELARERERAREREAAKERELARERLAAAEREAAKEKQASTERDASKERVVSYAKDQSKPNGTIPGAKVPSFTASGGTKAE